MPILLKNHQHHCQNDIQSTRPSGKLDVKRLGPFQINQKVSTVAYKLDLPASLRIHPVFHVSLLEKYIPNTFENRIQEPPPPLVIEGEEEFEVEAILDSRLHYRKLQYLVKWLGYPSSENSWEPSSSLTNCPEKLSRFHLSYPNKPGPRIARCTRSLEGR